MSKEITKVILVLLAIVSFSDIAMGQQSSNNEQSKTPQQTSSNPSKAPEPAKTPEPEYVDFTGFKGKIIELKHREPSDIISVVSPLGSGFKGAKLVANRYTQPKSITIRDFPENIAAIEEAVKRLDVPLPPAPPLPKPEPAPAPDPNVEVRLQILLASGGEVLKTDPLPAEIQNGDGVAELDEQARLLDSSGQDVTAEFVSGAQQALALAQQHNIRVAILKARSPSCGNAQIYDGTFGQRLIAGRGVTAALLERHGVKVFNEDEIAAAPNYAAQITKEE